MPEHDHYDDKDLFNPETHHESSDVPIRPLWWAIGIFIVFGIVTHIVLGFMYKGLVVMERDRMDPPETAIARPANADVPQNQPLLQPFPRTDAENRELPPTAATPVADMIAMRAAEEKVLSNYGWVDRQQGIVHIPIEKAKSLTAARLALEGQLGSVPAATAAPAATTAPAAAGEAVTPPVTQSSAPAPTAGGTL